MLSVKYVIHSYIKITLSTTEKDGEGIVESGGPTSSDVPQVIQTTSRGTFSLLYSMG